MKNSGIATLFKAQGTVLTPTDLAVVWGITNTGYLKSRITYYVRKGYLFRLCRGLYVKDRNNFDPLEVGNKLRSPSYVSFETVLAREGIVFQKYSAIFLASYTTKTVQIAAGEFIYKKIRDSVLFNPDGLVMTGTCCIASRERAFLDSLYLYKDYHFDNLRPIDWERVENLLPVYRSGALRKRAGEYRKNARPE